MLKCTSSSHSPLPALLSSFINAASTEHHLHTRYTVATEHGETSLRGLRCSTNKVLLLLYPEMPAYQKSKI